MVHIGVQLQNQSPCSPWHTGTSTERCLHPHSDLYTALYRYIQYRYQKLQLLALRTTASCVLQDPQYWPSRPQVRLCNAAHHVNSNLCAVPSKILSVRPHEHNSLCFLAVVASALTSTAASVSHDPLCPK
jgi:hypothetical protein